MNTTSIRIAVLVSLSTSVLVVGSIAPDGKPPVAPALPVVREGYYVVSGRLPSGQAYEGVGTVRRNKDVYLVHWHLGETVISGIGLLTVGGPGTKELLTVGFASATGDGRVGRGAVAFRSTAKGLRGDWVSHPGDGRVHREDWEFLRPWPTVTEPPADVRVWVKANPGS